MKKTFIFLFFIFLAFTEFSVFPQDNYLLENGRLRIPLDNKGIIADIVIGGNGGGWLDNKIFLYSAGFFLSGLNADSIWVNAQASASRIGDYQPGNVDSIPSNPKYRLYVVKKADLSFGSSWQLWKDAVDIGADFYDGNNDGIFNPIDLNSNGTWDPNEDKPDIIGDITTWCVYNDGVSDSLRRFLQDPLGIEIHQTLFAFEGISDNDPRRSTFFVRYKIINTGKVSNLLDSVYFGGWADTDLGSTVNAPFDDFAGCDTLSNSGYVYNHGDDEDWGVDPPAHFIKFLQGPPAYIPGVTFIDNNSNGFYDDGIDTPLDSAYNFCGVDFGIQLAPGAKNVGLSSFIHYMASHPWQGDPSFFWEARNYLKGLRNDGTPYDPCNWPYGIVQGGVDCSQVNPRYMYSGDPVNQFGWINNFETDQRQLSSTGSFRLEIGKPVNIIVAHIAGRGTDALNSISVSRNYSINLESFLNSNFTNIPVPVEDEDIELIPNSFQLFQNYPNPFNPTTTIRYELPLDGIVTIEVFDILGQKVRTLLNEFKKADRYEIDFNASALSSGIYFYQLKAGEFIQTKKMLLLK